MLTKPSVLPCTDKSQRLSVLRFLDQVERKSEVCFYIGAFLALLVVRANADTSWIWLFLLAQSIQMPSCLYLYMKQYRAVAFGMFAVTAFFNVLLSLALPMLDLQIRELVQRIY